MYRTGDAWSGMLLASSPKVASVRCVQLWNVGVQAKWGAFHLGTVRFERWIIISAIDVQGKRSDTIRTGRRNGASSEMRGSRDGTEN